MSSKTPFELRFELLSLANSYLQAKHEDQIRKLDTAEQNFPGRGPDFPTSDEIIELAVKFKYFVDDSRG